MLSAVLLAGFNCAEATNFATTSWLELGAQADVCECRNDCVSIDMREFLSFATPEVRDLINTNFFSDSDDSDSNAASDTEIAESDIELGSGAESDLDDHFFGQSDNEPYDDERDVSFNPHAESNSGQTLPKSKRLASPNKSRTPQPFKAKKMLEAIKATKPRQLVPSKSHSSAVHAKPSQSHCTTDSDFEVKVRIRITPKGEQIGQSKTSKRAQSTSKVTPAPLDKTYSDIGGCEEANHTGPRSCKGQKRKLDALLADEIQQVEAPVYRPNLAAGQLSSHSVTDASHSSKKSQAPLPQRTSRNGTAATTSSEAKNAAQEEVSAREACFVGLELPSDSSRKACHGESSHTFAGRQKEQPSTSTEEATDPQASGPSTRYKQPCIMGREPQKASQKKIEVKSRKRKADDVEAIRDLKSKGEMDAKSKSASGTQIRTNGLRSLGSDVPVKMEADLPKNTTLEYDHSWYQALQQQISPPQKSANKKDTVDNAKEDLLLQNPAELSSPFQAAKSRARRCMQQKDTTCNRRLKLLDDQNKSPYEAAKQRAQSRQCQKAGRKQ